MSIKRGAQSTLTHDNWDEEETSEDRGSFVKADNAEISRRVIKVGRRKSHQNTPQPSNIFSGFGGFNTTASALPSASSLFSNLNKTVPTGNTNLLGTSETASDKSVKEANNNSITNGKIVSPGTTDQKDTTVVNKYKTTSMEFERQRHSQVFQHKLTSLNKSIVSWITKHVEDNACVDLTPVFSDYKIHLEKIDNEYKQALADVDKNIGSVESKPADTGSKPDTSTAVDSKSAFGFLNKTTSGSETKPTSQPMIFGSSANGGMGSLFGANPTTVSSDASKLTSSEAGKPSLFAGLSSSTALSGETSIKPLANLFAPIGKTEDTTKTDNKPASIFPAFNFQSSSSSAAITSGFGAGDSSASKAPTFGGFGSLANSSGAVSAIASSTAPVSASGDTADQNKAEEGGESEEPPKTEFTAVEEPDAYYSIRCKLFYRKETEWKSKGVGMLHFKQVEDDKTQLVLRADTNIGNIILNIILDPEAPIKKSGKNMVTIVTTPNPPIDSDPKPTPLMFKVKSESDCEELFEKLSKPKVG